MAGPDFVGIGAQRTGTTWLFSILERHPRLWLPPLKELHYFDDLEGKNRKRYYDFLRTRLISGLWVRRPLSWWDARYFLKRRNDDWYAGLFARANHRGLIAGEITPSYATLPIEIFEQMLRMNPKLKIIFIMRDPIMRSWSSVIKSRRKRKLLDFPTAEVAIKHAQGEGVSRKSCYSQTVKRIDTVFPQDQIFYGFYEDLAKDPRRFVVSVLEFLGAQPVCPDTLHNDIPIGAAAAGRRPPIEFESALAASYLPDVIELCRKFEGAPHVWRARYEMLLGANASPSLA